MIGTCKWCKGSGEVLAMTREYGPDDYEYLAICPDCGGTGVEFRECYGCSSPTTCAAERRCWIQSRKGSA